MQYIKFQGSRKFLNISLQCRLKGNRLCHLGSNLKKKYKEKVNKKNTAFWKQAIKQHELPKVKIILLLTLFLLLRGSCSFLWNTITHNIYKQKTMHIYCVKIIENITLLQKSNQYINIKYTQSLNWIQITRFVLTEFSTSQCTEAYVVSLATKSFIF